MFKNNKFDYVLINLNQSWGA